MIGGAQHTPGPTPTPWEVKDAITPHNIYIEAVGGGPEGGFVCDMQADESDTATERARIEATAKFIVLACNTREELLAAAQAAVAAGIGDVGPGHTGGWRECGCVKCMIVRKLDAAIAKVEGRSLHE